MPGIVALAGASSGVGAAIVDALIENGVTDYVILARRPSTQPRAVVVDYNDVDALARTLEEHQVDTVISTLSIGDDASGQAQMNLIKAADHASCTRRFIPSEFGMVYKPSNIAHVPSYKWKLEAADALSASSLEYTLISIGLFLDYWSTPRIPTHLRSAPPMFLDLEHRIAAIPGDGTAPFVVTHSRDAGRFTVALLDLPKWERRYAIPGDRVTMKEVVHVAGEVLGAPIDVHWDSAADIREGKATLTPRLKDMVKGSPMEDFIRFIVSQTALNMLAGELNLGVENNLVEMFPDIKPLTVLDAVAAWQ